MLFLVALIKDTGMGSFNNPEFSLGPGPPSPNSTHSDPYPISGLLCEETFVTISKLNPFLEDLFVVYLQGRLSVTWWKLVIMILFKGIDLILVKASFYHTLTIQMGNGKLALISFSNSHEDSQLEL